MRFAHFADIHLGAWREPKLQELNLETFKKAIGICIEEKVDFIIIAGDLFDTAMPPIEILKEAVSELKKLKDSGIGCYVIAGSHDFSVSGKTFLDVIEKAGLCKNVSLSSEQDMGNGDMLTVLETCEHDGCIFAGLPGKKGGLETRAFKNLQMHLPESKSKAKIFMMHTTLTEAKPKDLYFIESVDIEELPDGFDYYAGGHLHIVFESSRKGKPVVYPGPLFPNNFQELEELKQGSFCIVDIGDGKCSIRKEKIKLKDVVPVSIDVSGMKPELATEAIIKKISEHEVKEKILALKISGCIDGKTSDMDFDRITAAASECYAMLKNTNALTSSSMSIETHTQSNNIQGIEDEIIKRYIKDENEWDFIPFINTLMHLDMEKQEGETVAGFESRVNDEAIKILGLKERMER